MVFLNNKMYLYYIDEDYLKTLRAYDPEVQYTSHRESTPFAGTKVHTDSHYDAKPFLGVLVTQNNHNYFIPLTSPKPKHASWAISSKEHILICEDVDVSKRHKKWVCKPTTEDNTIKHILGVLEIKKMIPVPNGAFHKIDINAIPDDAYRTLLKKEWAIIKHWRDKIIESADKTYQIQVTKKDVRKYHCNYRLLEKVCDKYTTLNLNGLLQNAETRSAQTITKQHQRGPVDYTMA